VIAAVAAAAALMSPVFGDGPHNEGIAVLKPGTLRVQCKLPPKTDQVEVSPDAKYLAAGDAKGLHIRAAKGCVKLDDERVTTFHRVLSWLDEDMLVLVKRGKPITLRFYSVAAGKVVARRTLRERLGDTARVDDRQVTLTAPKSGDLQTLRVYAPDGTLEHTIPLPGVHNGTLHGNTPLPGIALVLSGDQPTAYLVNIASGATVRRDLTLPAGTLLRWVEPQIPGMLAIGDYDTVAILDPATFAVKRVVHPGSKVKGAGEGFISVSDDGAAPLKAYDGNGDLLWSHKLDILDASAFRGRVYAGSGYNHVRIRVYDLADGSLTRMLRGRAYLFEASHGRVAVPYFTNQAIVED
jgi:hypothetical protein